MESPPPQFRSLFMVKLKMKIKLKDGVSCHFTRLHSFEAGLGNFYEPFVNLLNCDGSLSWSLSVHEIWFIDPFLTVIFIVILG